MKASELKQWSESLRAETKIAIEEMRIGSPDGRLHFKNIDGRASFIGLNDLISSELLLHDKEDGKSYYFANAEELIEAGWAID